MKSSPLKIVKRFNLGIDLMKDVTPYLVIVMMLHYV